MPLPDPYLISLLEQADEAIQSSRQLLEDVRTRDDPDAATRIIQNSIAQLEVALEALRGHADAEETAVDRDSGERVVLVCLNDRERARSRGEVKASD